MTKLTAVQGDITRQAVDAVVNAANGSLMGGGGVDGAIHRAAGQDLLAECRTLGGCKTGEAKLTGGYNLPARHVIHTVGPVYDMDREEAPRLLANCYRNSLRLAREHGLRRVAFPGISTGVYGYPPAEAAGIAVTTVREQIAADPTSFDEIIFVAFSSGALQLYESLLET